MKHKRHSQQSDRDIIDTISCMAVKKVLNSAPTIWNTSLKDTEYRKIMSSIDIMKNDILTVNQDKIPPSVIHYMKSNNPNKTIYQLILLTDHLERYTDYLDEWIDIIRSFGVPHVSRVKPSVVIDNINNELVKIARTIGSIHQVEHEILWAMKNKDVHRILPEIVGTDDWKGPIRSILGLYNDIILQMKSHAISLRVDGCTIVSSMKVKEDSNGTE